MNLVGFSSKLPSAGTLDDLDPAECDGGNPVSYKLLAGFCIVGMLELAFNNAPRL